MDKLYTLTNDLMQVKSLTDADNAMLTEFVHLLTKFEQTPGGPYGNPDHPLYKPANEAIAQLFTKLGTPLPNLQHFLHVSKVDVIRSPQTMKLIEEDKQSLPKATHPTIDAFAQRIDLVDSRREIRTFTSTFLASLKNQPMVSQQLLSRASIFTWMAYSIYDDLIDEDTSLHYLPIATILQRRALTLYEKAFPDRGWHKATQAFDAMDSANHWELVHCRVSHRGKSIEYRTVDFGDNHFIADRASGHLIGCLLLCDNPHIEAGLSSYLIAKQFLDDMHDWREDFNRGHMTPVLSLLIANTPVRHRHRSGQLRYLEHYFWHEGITLIANKIITYANEALSNLEASQLLKPKNNFIVTFIQPVKAAARQAINNNQAEKKFISSLTNDTTANHQRPLPPP